MLVLLLSATLWYTVPARETPFGCDSVRVTCNEDSTVCDTVVVHSPERMGSIRLWWMGPGSWQVMLLRTKLVAGLEGMEDSLIVPQDSLRSIRYWVDAVDAAGNVSCMNEGVTVYPPNWPVSVDPIPVPPAVRYYDISGRRLRELDGLSVAEVRRSGRSGVLFMRIGNERTRKLVILR